MHPATDTTHASHNERNYNILGGFVVRARRIAFGRLFLVSSVSSLCQLWLAQWASGSYDNVYCRSKACRLNTTIWQQQRTADKRIRVIDSMRGAEGQRPRAFHQRHLQPTVHPISGVRPFRHRIGKKKKNEGRLRADKRAMLMCARTALG